VREQQDVEVIESEKEQQDVEVIGSGKEEQLDWLYIL
jgi:hypothetical protein